MRPCAVLIRQAVLTARIAARLPRVEPVLQGTGQQPIGDIPQIRVLVLVGNAVAQIDGFGESRIERVGELFGHALRRGCP